MLGHRRFSISVFIFVLSSLVLLNFSIHVPQGTAIPVSWNPHVSCPGPTVVKLKDILGAAYPSQTPLSGSYQTSSTTGGVPNKRALTPPCTLTNTSGQTVSSFVQLNNLTLISSGSGYFYETRDCKTSYDAVNGGGSFPNGKSLCDSTGNVNEVGTTNGAYVHLEFDRDWMAFGWAGPSTTYDNNNTIANVHLPCTISSPCAGNAAIDIQGFVFWDSEGQGHWEIHPITAWRLHGSDFTISANPTSLTLTAGTVGTSTITVASQNNFTGTVSLSSTVSPSGGLVCSLSPTSITLTTATTTSTSALSCNASQGGVYNTTVTGVSSGLTHATSITFTVRDFSIASNPGSVTVSAGGKANSTITVTSINSFSGTVNVATTTSPPGLTCSLSPTSVVLGTSGTSTLSCNGIRGNYTATVTGSAGSLKHNVTVAIRILSSLAVSVSCPSAAIVGSPITCNASASGGLGPYMFSWSAPGGSPQTGTGASFTTTYATKGTFVVNATAMDANNTRASQTASFVVSAQPIAVTVVCSTATAGKPVACNVSATGGTVPYTFVWASKGTPSTGTGTSYTPTFGVKGSQTVNATATDLNGVSKLGQLFISVAAQPIVVTVTCGTATVGKPVTCNASATGGTAPFTFSWASKGSPATGASSSYTTTFASKGSQTVNATATDLNGVFKLGQATVSVTAQPIVVTVTCGTATAGKPVTCNASATGGTAPFTFSWASKGTISTGTGTSYTTMFASKGSQTINSTATDLNGVSKLGQTTVSVTAQPIVVTVTCGTASAGKPVTCNASTSGGTNPFTFTWSATGGNPSTGAGTGFTTIYVSKGTFVVNVTATDANNSQKSGMASLVVTAQPIVVTVTCGNATTGEPVTCNASATGGTSPYTFSWSAISGTPSTGSGASFTTTYVTKGTFVVNATLTDSNSLKTSQTTSIFVAANPIIVSLSCGSAAAGSPVTCHSSAIGGTTPYTFSWSALAGSPASGSGSSFNVTFASKGSFTVNATAIDVNGAKTSSIANVVVAAQPITLNIADSPALTVGTPISFTSIFMGGTGPYTILWRFGDGSNSTQTSPSHTYSVKGSYTVTATVTDANGASANSSIQITISAQALITSVSCGTATAGKPLTCIASPTGGTAPYTFTWASKGTPATGTGSSYTTTFAAKGSQVVNATATDLNGVSMTGQAIVKVAAQPIVITVTCGAATAGKPVTCNADVTGGTTPYSFTWASKGTPATGTGANYTTTFATKGSQIVNATAKDANNVSSLGQATTNVAAQSIVVTAACGTATAGKPVTCNASVIGGTSPYTFSWSAPGGSPASGDGASFITTYPTKGINVVNATATDANNVKKSATTNVVVAAQPLTGTASASPVLGTAGQSTMFTGSSSGGAAPYTFSWSFGDNSSKQPGNPASHTYTTLGNYTVVLNITDVNSATVSILQIYRVNARLPLQVSFATPSPLVATRLGNFTAAVSGGIGPYSFSWSFGDNTTGTGISVQHSYSAGLVNYTVTLSVTDSKGSTGTASSQLLVWRTPDLNGDGKVTILDASIVAFAFDTKLGDSNYNPRADLDGDGKIGILDIAVIAFYFDSTGW